MALAFTDLRDLPSQICVTRRAVHRLQLVYITFGALGVATLLPWNVVLTETEYFLVRSHQAPFSQRIADNFPSVLANSYTLL